MMVKEVLPMIKHIVLFQVKEECKVEIPTMIERFKQMKEEIPELAGFRIGADFVHSARSYDVGLIATVKDEEALDIYANHPAHLPLKKHMAEISKSVVSVDFIEN